MKNNRLFKCARALALLLALATLMTLLVSCGGDDKKEIPDPVLERGEEKLPLYFYEFMLSRMKGTLARNKYEVSSSEFWDTETEDGRTYEEYYNQSILESCKNYLAAAVFFDSEGMKLPDSTVAEIDEEVAFYVEYDGAGSEERFDRLIAKYGVDSESLRECYIIEAKYKQVIASVYGGGGLIDNSVKEEYYRDNYVRFKQILLPKFYYEYERDSNGDLMYFDTETGKTLYDKENGVYHYDANDNYIKDRFGVAIRYDSEGNILYDKVKGQPSVKLDEDGNGIRHDLEDEEIAANKELAESLAGSLKSGKYTAFEAEMKNHVHIEGYGESYPDGYYLSSTELAGYDRGMLGIYEKLKTMEDGEIALYESEDGFHVIMKYELDEGKYSDGEYAEWFTNFEDSLINMLFINKVEKILPEITVNEENLKKARSIRNIGTNFDY